MTETGNKVSGDGGLVEYQALHGEEFFNLLLEKSLPIIKFKKVNGALILRDNFKPKHQIEIENCIFESIDFNGCEVSELFSMTNCVSTDTIYFRAGNFGRCILANHQGTSISFLDAKFSESFLLTWRSLTSLHVDGAKFEKGLYVNEKFGGQKESGQLLHLEMNIESRSEIGKVYFNGVAIRNTILRGLIVNSTVKFKNVKFNNIKIEDLSNGGKMSFDGLLPLEENSIFEMKDSEIGNTEFISMDFTKIKLKISNSQLINVKSFNSSWPSKILTVADSPSAEKEIFQQLKQALSSQGDKIQAFDFERREKQLHYQTLRWPKHFFDKFALLTSWTNDHGQNWIRPLMLLLASSGFFYILVIVRLRSITFYNIHWSIENVVKHLGFLLAFLNPLHSLTLFVGNLPSFGYSFLFDNLQRIFSGYFLFQLVTAFRKFMIRR